MLENVIVADESIDKLTIDAEIESLVAKLFERWRWTRTVRGAFRELRDDLRDIKENDPTATNPFVYSYQQIESSYSAFLGSLSNPGTTNKCRADSFDNHNQAFKHSLLFSEDVFRVLGSAQKLVQHDDTDWEHWKIMGAMMLRFPEEMERWTARKPLSFELLEEEGRFEIWQIVRMYMNHLVGPNDGLSLFDFWTRPPHDVLGSKIWQERQESYQRSQIGLEKLLRELYLKEDGSSSDEQIEYEDEQSAGEWEVFSSFILNPNQYSIDRT